MTRMQELRWLKEKYGLTYDQLAILAGLSPHAGCAWKPKSPKNVRVISIGAMNRLKDALADFEYQQNNDRVDLPWLMHIPREEYDPEPPAVLEAQAIRTAKYVAARKKWAEENAQKKAETRRKKGLS